MGRQQRQHPGRLRARLPLLLRQDHSHSLQAGDCQIVEHNLIKWKDSIKTVVGLAHPKKQGLDI
jgi:hypothetical protein